VSARFSPRNYGSAFGCAILWSTELVREGERDRAMAIVRKWVADQATGFIKITDPYFGPEDLEMVQLIRSTNPSIPIYILSSRKRQQRADVLPPWDDTYRSHWRLAVSDCDPGDVTVVIVGKRSSGDHPIHDRWWLSETSGLRMGTSANSVGVGKLSEVSAIDPSEVGNRLTEVDRYLSGSVKECGTDRILYSSFKL
jgi:hypothetical protein